MKRFLTLIAALACFCQMFASYYFCYGPNDPLESPELTLGSNVMNITEEGSYYIYNDDGDCWIVDGDLNAPFESKVGTFGIGGTCIMIS